MKNNNYKEKRCNVGMEDMKKKKPFDLLSS
jgi:hypothetical protein